MGDPAAQYGGVWGAVLGSKSNRVACDPATTPRHLNLRREAMSEAKSKVPSQQPFNVRARPSKKRIVRKGAEPCDYVANIMRRSQLERDLVAGCK